MRQLSQPINDPSVTSTVLTSEEMNVTSQKHQIMTSQVVTSQHVGMTTQQQVLTQPSLAYKSIHQLTVQDNQNLAQQNNQVVSTQNQGVVVQDQQLRLLKTTSPLKSNLLSSPQSALQQTSPVTIVPSQINQQTVMSPQHTPTVSPNKQVSQQTVTQQSQNTCQQSVVQQISQIPNITPEVLAQLQRITANQQTVVSTPQTSQQISSQVSNQRPILPQPTQVINVSQQSDRNSDSSVSVIGKEDTINNQQWIEICPDSSLLVVL